MDGGFVVSAPMLAFVCFMVFLAGFVDASAGGGGLIGIPAYLFTGMPAHCALGCNKLSSACGTTVSVVKFWRSGAVEPRSAAVAFAASLAGSAAGARIALMMSDAAIKTVMLVVLPCVAAVVLFRGNVADGGTARQAFGRREAALSAVIGFLIGGYDGLIGPGTGTFAIIAFSALLGLDLRTSSGNAKILNAASNYASLATFITAGAVIYSIAVPAALCNVAGNYLGSRCALTKGARFIRPMMLCVLAALMLKLLWDVAAG
ncbi:TSUP family transporter [Cloacibacillus sp. An23]|uniref:sulfite exporter TauE/SafE family protein n=1 Tax=Cloacibacillus sp. An23 TaxID=1965591 RepID=UPI000B55617A|nr:TSUP family transporter [Cloacibacillus sp. An23]OUO95111.1 hypothetical protein B5F39_00855 [Cloacibacillus sp. An23]